MPERLKEAILVEYDSGKLKDSYIKKFLAGYYEGNPNDMLKGSNKQSLLEDFILINQNLIGDNLESHNTSELYIRHGKPHCCAVMLETLPNGNLYCTVCGTEYEGGE